MDRVTPYPHCSNFLLHNYNLPTTVTHANGVVAGPTIDVLYHSSSKPASTYLSNYEFGKLKTLDSVKQLHTQVVKFPRQGRSDWDLVKAYMRFCDLCSSVTVFFLGSANNFLVWKKFLQEYERFGGDPCGILEAFVELNRKGVEFDSWVLTVVLKLCGLLLDVRLGVEVHAYLIKKGFELDVGLKSALLDFYGMCYGADYAEKVFDEMPKRAAAPLSLWRERIAANLRNSDPNKALEMFQEMQLSGVKPDCFTIAKVVQACGKIGAFDEGKQIHGYVVRNALERELPVCNSLINLYAKNNNGGIVYARSIFDSMEIRNLSCWNSMISGYASLGYFAEAWKLFGEMDVKPDEVTWNSLLSSHYQHGLYEKVVTILRRMVMARFKPRSRSINPAIQAASELNLLELGKELHCYTIRNGLDYDAYVGAILLDMYIKNDSLVKAQLTFNLMKSRNIVAWNTLISGYAAKGLFDGALELLNQMEEEGIKPDTFTWTGLVSGYSLHGRVKDALDILHHMEASDLKPTTLSWNALISGCSRSGNHSDAIQLFRQLVQKGVKPNIGIVSSTLQSCAALSLLKIGKEIHCLCVRNGFSENAIGVSTALINMYSKSGSLESASNIFFRGMTDKTLGTWNSMIGGYAVHNRGKEGVMLFDVMCRMGVQPDAITFTAVLSGCKNSGLLEEGWKYFDRMKADYGITPTVEHYSCMVDLLGRCGYLDEAWDLIQTMPVKADASTWGALLRSCRVHNNLKLGKIAAKHLFELEPMNSANYTLLMNIYSMANRWEDVDQLREKMIAQGIKARSSRCWIQIDDRVHVFSEDEHHPDAGEIYFQLYQLVSGIKKMGYVPDVECVYQQMDDTEKEKLLMSHPEKLAITYGLMKKKSNSPIIRVIKNTRVCPDCHTAAKFISSIRNCEILLKDGVRFHRFRQGKCSCNDCW